MRKKDFTKGYKMTFKAGDIVVSKDEFIDKHETLQDTVGLVIDYNPANDYLVLGDLHPENYAIPPTYSMRGCYYRLVSEEEKTSFKL